MEDAESRQWFVDIIKAGAQSGMSDYQAKRTILSIILETVRLNCENIEFFLRKNFDLLQDQNLVPLSGAMGI